MSRQIQTSIYHDTRRLKKDGTYPVKLRLYDPTLKKTKLYPLGLAYTKQDFDRIWNTSRPKGTYKDERMVLQEIESRAMDIMRGMNFLDLRTFERKFLRKSGSGSDVFYHFKDRIDRYKNEGRVGTAQSYSDSMKSFESFLEHQKVSTDNLPFIHVNEDWLDEYESFMLKNGRSLTTVGIYVRSLRAIFYKAIEEGEVHKELLPFGRSKYSIPAPRKKKSVLNNHELKLLMNSEPRNLHQQKAKDFFFLSMALFGINLSDIASLRWKDVKGEHIRLVRAKIARSTRSNQKESSKPIIPYARAIFNKYGVKDDNDDALVFDIHSDELSPDENRIRRKNFVRYINQHLSNLAKSLGIRKRVSYQIARHSFATRAIRQGYSMEFVSEALDHENLKTTLNYIEGFEDETKKEIAEKLFDF